MAVQVSRYLRRGGVQIIFPIGTTSTTARTTVPPSISACRFEYPGKGVIDFSFIGRTDEKAAYTDETTRAASNFSMFIQF